MKRQERRRPCSASGTAGNKTPRSHSFSEARRRSEEGRRDFSFPFPISPLILSALFRALGIVFFFASSVVLVAAILALSVLDWRMGAAGGVLSVGAALVGLGLVSRILP